jgi:hypothetical protein
MAGSPPHGPVSHRLALHRRLIGLGMRECLGRYYCEEAEAPIHLGITARVEKVFNTTGLLPDHTLMQPKL